MLNDVARNPRSNTLTQAQPGEAAVLDFRHPVRPGQMSAGETHRQITHDIRHQLATIALLADLIGDAPDTGPAGRRTARLIRGEVRWLEQLHRALEALDHTATSAPRTAPPESVSVDEIAVEVTTAIRPVASARLRLDVVPASARVGRLALWRVLRNLLDNAVRAAGPSGTVDVRVAEDGDQVTISVDDDGPGFGLGPSGYRAVGLSIVQEFVASSGGELEIGRGSLGGCGFCIRLPAAAGPVDGHLDPEADRSWAS